MQFMLDLMQNAKYTAEIIVTSSSVHRCATVKTHKKESIK